MRSGAAASAAAFLFLWIAACNPPQPPVRPAMTLERVERIADHVLLVSIDGLRPDAIDACDAIHLKELIGRGVHAANARSVEPSLTMPSHASMLTGLEVAGHGVTWNDITPGWIGHPTLLSAARGAAMRTGAFYAKTKLRYLFRPGTVHVEVCIDGVEDSAASLARAFATAWADAPFDLAFVHLREPDSAGHLEGWMSEPYLRAVEAADRAVGEILEAIRASGRLERTAVIVTADHGGTGTHHWSDPEIPWICAGPGVPRGARIERKIHTWDTAPTALLFLGLRADHIDGRPVVEAFRSDKSP